MNTPKDLTQEQIKLLPTEQDIKHYEEMGWYISKKIIPDEIIDSAKKGASAFYKGEIDYNLDHKIGIADDIFDANLAIQNNEFVTLQKKELQKLGFYPLISAIASMLARTNKINLFADSLINKLPQKLTNKGIVGWHSDKAYWPTCSSNNIVTAWIPLQDCTENMGPLTHINRSNLWKEDQKSYKKNGEKIVIGYDKICAKDSFGNPDYRDPKIFPVLWEGKL